MRHGPFALPITRYLKPPQAQPFWTQHALWHSVCGWLAQNWRTKAITDQSRQSAQERSCIDYDYKVRDKILLINKVSSTKQSLHMAKNHGLSLQFIQMQLSWFNVEPDWNDLVSREYNHLQTTFYKLGQKYTSQDHKFYYSFSYSHKILCFSDSNTILTSSMTTRMVTLIFFHIKVLFRTTFRSDSFICGGECHKPWHYDGKHSLLNVAIF